MELDALLALLLASPGAVPAGVAEAELKPRLAALLAGAVAVAAAFSLEGAQPTQQQPQPAAWSLVPVPPKGRKLVGFAAAAGDRSLVATLSCVAVAPSERRRGLGRRLVTSLLGQLRSQGVADIGLVAPESSRAFFEACSFAPDSGGAVYMKLSQV